MDLWCKEKILSNDYADWIIDFELTEELQRLDQSGVDYCYDRIDDALGIVYAKRSQMEEIGLLNYSYQQIPGLLAEAALTTEETDAAFDPLPLAETGVLRIQREPLKLTGKGTVMVFIGSGIDYTNSVFRKPDGNTRILAVWDQNVQEGTPPATAGYGREYKKEEIDAALETDNPREILSIMDESGVTTSLASVAVGSPLVRPDIFSGVAPETEIVVVKLKECKPYLRDYYLVGKQAKAYQTTDIIKAVEYGDSFAREFYRPVIFFIALGSNYGSHSGNTPLSRYLERIGRKRGRAVVIYSGEEGNKNHHFSTVIGGQEENNREEIELRVGEGERGFLAEIWGSLPNRYVAGVRSPSGEQLAIEKREQKRGIQYQFGYENTRLTITYAAADSDLGDQLIILRFENPAEGIWTIILEREEGVGESTVHFWLPNEEFLSGETYFLKPDPQVTLTVPSFVKNAVSVTAYNVRNNSIYPSCGRGFSRTGEIKPDLAAPGVEISTVLKSIPGQLRIGKQTGAALAAAITAGTAAQLLEWAYRDKNANYLNSNDVRSIFIQLAKRDRNFMYPNPVWGWGKLRIN